MTESKALLTQNEIDTLINFLQSHTQSPIGSVLDQGSIDKLVEIIKFNNDKGVYFNKESAINLTGNDEPLAIIKDATGRILDAQSCSFICEKDADGFVNVVCLEKTTGTRVNISPSCINRKEFLEDDAKWGLAVSPHTLIRLSGIFGINCDADTLKNAEKDFAKLVYGDENAKIADCYMS